MRLNKSQKKAFVTSIMDDVPQVDYGTEINKLVVDAYLAQLPSALIEALDKDPSIKSHLEHTYVSAGFSRSIAVLGRHNNRSNMSGFAPEKRAKITELSEKAQAQEKEQDKLRGKLWDAVEACSTLKQLQNALPEFASYMPKEVEAIRNLPAVRGVFSDFQKAGFPKGKEAKK